MISISLPTLQIQKFKSACVCPVRRGWVWHVRELTVLMQVRVESGSVDNPKAKTKNQPEIMRTQSQKPNAEKKKTPKVFLWGKKKIRPSMLEEDGLSRRVHNGDGQRPRA